MATIHGTVRNAAARIDEADNPIDFMDSLSSTLESLGKFNAVVDKIATVRIHAMRLEVYGLIESPDSPLCSSSVDSSQFCGKGSPIAHFFLTKT
jgi:hypothetical protein